MILLVRIFVNVIYSLVDEQAVNACSKSRMVQVVHFFAIVVCRLVGGLHA